MARRFTVEYDDNPDYSPEWEYLKLRQHVEGPNMALAIYDFHRILRKEGSEKLREEYYELMKDYLELVY